MSACIQLARRTSRMGASAIREILKVTEKPGMISLAGGLPAPESFPTDLIRRLSDQVMTGYGARALQYGPSEGFAPLREAVAEHLSARHIHTTPDAVLVTSGSQGALDALGKVLISRGDRVAVEAPTYLGALQAFNPYEPTYVQIASDNKGMIPGALEEALRRRPVKFVYLVPTFQNPTGRTLGQSRRLALVEILQRHDTLVIEDDPYSALCYAGTVPAPIKSLAPDHTVYVGTLSKVLAPGLRVGYCLAPPPLDRQLVLAKQGCDLHTGTFAQALAAAYLAGGHLSRHLPEILSLYRPRCRAMLTALARCMPDGFSWSQPNGGMFVWVEGPVRMDMDAVYAAAVARGAAFVPGRHFYPDPDQGRHTMRLNFTLPREAEIDRAVAILGAVVRQPALAA